MYVSENVKNLLQQFGSSSHGKNLQVELEKLLENLLHLSYLDPKMWQKDRNDLATEIVTMHLMEPNPYISRVYHLLLKCQDEENLAKFQKTYSHLKFQPDFHQEDFQLLTWAEIEKRLETKPTKKKAEILPSSSRIINGPMSNLSKSLTLKNYKKGLFRNLKLNSGEEMKDKQLKIEELPFWCDVYNKDFSLKLDEIYGHQSEFSKAEIVQKYQLFRWASNSSHLFSNKHNLDLNFGEILYCYLIHFKRVIPIYESLPNSSCHTYDQPEPMPEEMVTQKDDENILPELSNDFFEVKDSKKFETSSNLFSSVCDEAVSVLDTTDHSSAAATAVELTNEKPSTNPTQTENQHRNNKGDSADFSILQNLPSFAIDDPENDEIDEIEPSSDNQESTDVKNEPQEPIIDSASQSLAPFVEPEIKGDETKPINVEPLTKTKKIDTEVKSDKKLVLLHTRNSSESEQQPSNDSFETIQPKNSNEVPSAKLLTKKDIEGLTEVDKPRRKRRKKRGKIQISIPPLLKLPEPQQKTKMKTYPEITYFQGSIFTKDETIPVVDENYEAGKYDHLLTENSIELLPKNFASVQYSIRKAIDKEMTKQTKNIYMREIGTNTIHIQKQIKESQTDRKQLKNVGTQDMKSSACHMAIQTNEEKPREMPREVPKPRIQVSKHVQVSSPLKMDASTETDILVEVSKSSEPNVHNLQHVPIAANVPQNVPNVPQTVPSVPQIVPSVPQTVPSVPQIIPSVPQNVPDVPFEPDVSSLPKIPDGIKEESLKVSQDNKSLQKNLTLPFNYGIPEIKITPPIEDLLDELDEDYQEVTMDQVLPEKKSIVIRIDCFSDNESEDDDYEEDEDDHDDIDQPRDFTPYPSAPIQLPSISDDNSRHDDIEDVMEEVSTVALAKLDLPFTTAYMAASTETSVPVTFTNDHRRLEDIPEVDTSQEE